MKFLLGLTAYAEPATQQAATGDTTMAMISSFLPLILMIVIFYFLLIRPQKKRDKQFREMLASLSVGDGVVLTCGIEGKVLSVRENDITIETGSDRTKLSFKKWAVKEVTTVKA